MTTQRCEDRIEGEWANTRQDLNRSTDEELSDTKHGKFLSYDYVESKMYNSTRKNNASIGYWSYLRFFRLVRWCRDRYNKRTCSRQVTNGFAWPWGLLDRLKFYIQLRWNFRSPKDRIGTRKRERKGIISGVAGRHDKCHLTILCQIGISVLWVAVLKNLLRLTPEQKELNSSARCYTPVYNIHTSLDSILYISIYPNPM